MKDQNKDNSGTLWPNPKKKEGDKRPDFTGAVTVNGKSMRVAGWWNERQKLRYIALTFSEPQKKPTASPTKPTPSNHETPV